MWMNFYTFWQIWYQFLTFVFLNALQEVGKKLKDIEAKGEAGIKSLKKTDQELLQVSSEH